MRVAMFSDIHGISTALDAVLAEIATLDVDRLLCLGDVAAGGPSPGAVIERLAELECPTVMGNTDDGLIDTPAWWRDPASIGVPEGAQRGIEIAAWAVDVIGDEHRRFVEQLPPTIEIDLAPGVDLLGFHGSPRSYDDYIIATTPDEDVAEMIAGCGQTVLVGGHTHVQLVRRIGEQTLVNVGSAGMPFACYGIGGTVDVLEHADYALVTATDGMVSIELRQVALDPEAITQEVRRSDMPHAEWFLDGRRAPGN